MQCLKHHVKLDSPYKFSGTPRFLSRGGGAVSPYLPTGPLGNAPIPLAFCFVDESHTPCQDNFFIFYRSPFIEE